MYIILGASALRAMGDSRRPLYVLAVACSLNIVLDLLLVVVFQMGVAGAATATIFCQGISACIVTWMLMSKEKMCSLRLKKIRFYMNSLRSVVRIGIPAGFEAAMYCVANIVIQVFVNRLGTDYVAAWGTFGKIDAAFWMIVNAFGISITTFVGQNYGAGQIRRMRRSVKDCLIMCYVSAVSMSILLMTFAELCTVSLPLTGMLSPSGVYMMRFLMPSYFPVCGDRNPFRSAQGRRESAGSCPSHLRRRMCFEDHMDVRPAAVAPGNLRRSCSVIRRPGALRRYFLSYIM